jgi:immunity protein 26 of polymorphic toxin system
VTRARYHEGDWFAVPLRSGGYAVGIVARVNPDGVLLGYFFGPRRAAVPSVQDVTRLSPGDAVLVGKFGHLGLKKGTWPVLGRAPGWDRAKWPMPSFVRFEELTGRSFRVFYDDNDPNRLLREEQVTPGVTEQGPRDGLMGAGYVEKALTSLLH